MPGSAAQDQHSQADFVRRRNPLHPGPLSKECRHHLSARAQCQRGDCVQALVVAAGLARPGSRAQLVQLRPAGSQAEQLRQTGPGLARRCCS